MADIVKRVDRNIPRNERSINFTDADAGTGDFLLVRDSLGRTASEVTIESTGITAVRLNSRQSVFKKNTHVGANPILMGRDMPATEQVYNAPNVAIITIEAGSTYVFENTFPIDTIELVSASGAFDIFCG